MTKIITVAHLRENVGKTITAIYFAYILSQRQRVLLLDFDIGGEEDGGRIRKFFEIGYLSPLADISRILSRGIDYAFKLADYGALWFMDGLLKSHDSLEQEIGDNSEVLRKVLKESGFDWIVIDTCFLPFALTRHAVFVCDHLLIPTTKDFQAFKTVERTLDIMRDAENPITPQTVTILLTMVENVSLEEEDYERFQRKDLVLKMLSWNRDGFEKDNPIEIPLDRYKLLDIGPRVFRPGQKMRIKATRSYEEAVRSFVKRVTG